MDLVKVKSVPEVSQKIPQCEYLWQDNVGGHRLTVAQVWPIADRSLELF